MAGLALVMMELSRQSNRMSKTAETKLEGMQLITQITAILADKAACTNTFSSLTPTIGATTTWTPNSLITKDNIAKYPIDSLFGKVTIKQYSLQTTDKIDFVLKLTVLRPKNIDGSREITYDIPVNVTLNPNDTVQACSSNQADVLTPFCQSLGGEYSETTGACTNIDAVNEAAQKACANLNGTYGVDTGCSNIKAIDQAALKACQDIGGTIISGKCKVDTANTEICTSGSSCMSLSSYIDQQVAGAMPTPAATPTPTPTPTPSPDIQICFDVTGGNFINNVCNYQVQQLRDRTGGLCFVEAIPSERANWCNNTGHSNTCEVSYSYYASIKADCTGNYWKCRCVSHSKIKNVTCTFLTGSLSDAQAKCSTNPQL